MGHKIKTVVINCPLRKREVEVTYQVTGHWFNREFDVVSCPAINDGAGCHLQCKSLLAQPPSLGEMYSRLWLQQNQYR